MKNKANKIKDAQYLATCKMRQNALLDRKEIICVMCGEKIADGDLLYDGIQKRGHVDCVDKVLEND